MATQFNAQNTHITLPPPSNIFYMYKCDRNNISNKIMKNNKQHTHIGMHIIYSQHRLNVNKDNLTRYKEDKRHTVVDAYE